MSRPIAGLLTAAARRAWRRPSRTMSSFLARTASVKPRGMAADQRPAARVVGVLAEHLEPSWNPPHVRGSGAGRPMRP